jgi:hypothetical protein
MKSFVGMRRDYWSGKVLELRHARVASHGP